MWDAAISQADEDYLEHMHCMVCGHDCHSHVAHALDLQAGSGSNPWALNRTWSLILAGVRAPARARARARTAMLRSTAAARGTTRSSWPCSCFFAAATSVSAAPCPRGSASSSSWALFWRSSSGGRSEHARIAHAGGKKTRLASVTLPVRVVAALQQARLGGRCTDRAMFTAFPLLRAAVCPSGPWVLTVKHEMHEAFSLFRAYSYTRTPRSPHQTRPRPVFSFALSESA